MYTRIEFLPLNSFVPTVPKTRLYLKVLEICPHDTAFTSMMIIIPGFSNREIRSAINVLISQGKIEKIAGGLLWRKKDIDAPNKPLIMRNQ